jgi:rhomboid protease GluP
MNLNLILSAVVVVLCVSTALRLRRIPLLEGLILLVLLSGVVLFPQLSGFVAMLAWMGLIGLPRFCEGRLATALVCGDYHQGARYGKWVAVFHPQRRWRARGLAACGLRAVLDGERSRGEFLLRRAEQLSPEVLPLIRLESRAAEGDWHGVLSASAAALSREVFEVTPFILHLRACGELGELETLDHDFLAFDRYLAGAGLTMARLMLGVFHGEVAFVRYLLAERLSFIPADIKDFWTATTYERAGDAGRANPIFEALGRSLLPGVAAAARRRLAAPGRTASPLSPELGRYVGLAVEDEVRFGDDERSIGPMTNLLLWLIGGVFVVESFWGHGVSLFELGAFWPSGVLVRGEWWRVVTALFLHVGVAHVAFNAVALRSLAPFVERTLGSWRFLIVYIGSGCGGLLLILGATALGALEERLVVGASGSIMGLVGATGAILHRATLNEGSRVARERLRAVGAIIGLQVLFDILVPQTSGTAHLLGAGLGYLLGRSLLRR